MIVEETSLGAGAPLIADRLQEALRAPFKRGAGGQRAAGDRQHRDRGRASAPPRSSCWATPRSPPHRAKWEGKNRCVVFEAGMQDLAQRHMQLEIDLRGALQRGEFFLVYQPTFDLRG